MTLTGSGFVAGTSVSIGGVSCATVQVVNSTTLTCTVAAHAVGAVDVVVTEGSLTGTLTGGYTYGVPPPQPVSRPGGTTGTGTAIPVPDNRPGGTTGRARRPRCRGAGPERLPARSLETPPARPSAAASRRAGGVTGRGRARIQSLRSPNCSDTSSNSLPSSAGFVDAHDRRSTADAFIHCPGRSLRTSGASTDNIVKYRLCTCNYVEPRCRERAAVLARSALPRPAGHWVSATEKHRTA